jgi:hypothetical protein
MIFRKAVIDQISVLSSHVYREVENFRNNLHINELERKNAVDLVWLGKVMFQMREKDLSMLKEDTALSVLVEKIQENRKRSRFNTKENNSYLSKYYNYVTQLFHKI